MDHSAKLVTRRAALGLAAAALAAPGAVRAQAVPNLTGHWQAYAGPVLVDLIIQGDGRYSSTGSYNGMMTTQSGHIVQQGMIVRFIVEDWQPRTQTMVGANNTRYQANLTQPANSNDRVISVTATHLMMLDLDTNTQVVLQRVG